MYVTRRTRRHHVAKAAQWGLAANIAFAIWASAAMVAASGLLAVMAQAAAPATVWPFVMVAGCAIGPGMALTLAGKMVAAYHNRMASLNR